MSVFRRALWADDATAKECTKCRAEFSLMCMKHHCRRCGLIYCNECTKKKLIVPEEEIVPRPQNWLQGKLPREVMTDEDDFRAPQRVCDPCSFQIRDLQTELRLRVSR